MRTWMALGILVSLLAVSPARAQLFSFGGGNPNPRMPIQNKPITVPDAAKPAEVPIAQPMRLAPNRFSLVNIMPRMGFPLKPIVHGQSIFPTPKNMPGKKYLKQFGYQRPKGIK